MIDSRQVSHTFQPTHHENPQTALYKLHERAEEDDSVRELLVELCLIVPARLSSIIPFLPLQMRLILHALKGKPDLANLGLRTLEFWVDNLNQDYLWPVLGRSPRCWRRS